MKRISLFLTEQQIERLHQLALRLGLPMAEMIRRFLDEGLQRAEKDQRRVK